MQEFTKKWFSVQNLQEKWMDFVQQFKKYPVSHLVSLLTFCSIAWLINTPGPDSKPENWDMLRRIFFLVSTLPLCFSVEYTLRDHGFVNNKIKLMVVLALFVFLGVEIFSFAKFEQTFAIQLIITFLCTHLVASFLPKKESTHAFWAFNLTLFNAFILASLFAAFLTSGIILAVVGVKELFGVTISDKVFGYIGALGGTFLHFIFFVRFFLNAKVSQPPKWLTKFATYVLLPLVSLYIVILYAYMGKILVEWTLPKGWVGILVSLAALFGILSFLLVFDENSKSKWTKYFTKLFYVLLVPMAALHLLAFVTRIQQYGITEERYLGICLGLWLLVVALYFILSKKDDISFIPKSLFLVCIIALCPKIGAEDVSIRSQMTRFKQSLQANQANDQYEATEIIKYLSAKPRKMNQVSGLLGVLPDSINKKADGEIAQYYINKYKLKDAAKTSEPGYYHAPHQSNVTETKGFDYFVRADVYNDNTETFELDAEKRITLDTGCNLTLFNKNQQVYQVNFKAKMDSVRKLNGPSNLGGNVLIDNQLASVKITPLMLQFDPKTNSYSSLNLQILLKEK